MTGPDDSRDVGWPTALKVPTGGTIYPYRQILGLRTILFPIEAQHHRRLLHIRRRPHHSLQGGFAGLRQADWQYSIVRLVGGSNLQVGYGMPPHFPGQRLWRADRLQDAAQLVAAGEIGLVVAVVEQVDAIRALVEGSRRCSAQVLHGRVGQAFQTMLPGLREGIATGAELRHQRYRQVC